ncbi:MAG: ferritin family protein [Deltaproteobacteria bacterium]|jgi:rubrerythrin|nr:ferritin family protein [Deltaproteobacteria bacterium]MBW2468917.1 ferritin family protein [Deltaproteobacteria bacterium]
MFTAHEILDLAIQLEENGETVYREAAGQAKNGDIREMLLWMAEEEVKHTRLFTELKQEIESRSINPFMEEMSRNVFGGILGDKSFSHRDVNFAEIDCTEDLIKIFIEFEKDTVLFYETLIPFIEDDRTLRYVTKIIEEENNHIKKLHELLTDKTKVPVADN